MDLSYLTVQQPEFDGSLHSRLSLHTVFSLYRQQFRRWFAITAPTSLIGSFILWIADDRVVWMGSFYSFDSGGCRSGTADVYRVLSAGR